MKKKTGTEIMKIAKFRKRIIRKCLMCGKEAKDSPTDICWSCMAETNQI
jgi:hypothetical protein